MNERTKKLTDLVNFCKEHKILSLKTSDGTEIALHPDALASAPASIAPDVVEGPDLDAVGSGGLSRRQQLELFNQVFETDFQRK